MGSEVQVTLTRDSVCMGDDMNDHTERICVTPRRDTTETVMSIAKEYLPSVAGRGHTWDCVLNGTKCAVIIGNCVEITAISDTAFLEISNLYFKYHSAAY